MRSAWEAEYLVFKTAENTQPFLAIQLLRLKEALCFPQNFLHSRHQSFLLKLPKGKIHGNLDVLKTYISALLVYAQAFSSIWRATGMISPVSSLQPREQTRQMNGKPCPVFSILLHFLALAERKKQLLLSNSRRRSLPNQSLYNSREGIIFTCV